MDGVVIQAGQRWSTICAEGKMGRQVAGCVSVRVCEGRQEINCAKGEKEEKMNGWGRQ